MLFLETRPKIAQNLIRLIASAGSGQGVAEMCQSGRIPPAASCRLLCFRNRRVVMPLQRVSARKSNVRLRELRIHAEDNQIFLNGTVVTSSVVMRSRHSEVNSRAP